MDDALLSAETVLTLAHKAGDHLLTTQTLLTKAELLQQVGRMSETLPILSGVADNLPSYPPDLHAQYERILACGLARSGMVDAAQAHFTRATRIYTSIRNVPGRLELTRGWNAATAAAALSQSKPQPDPSIRSTSAQATGAQRALQSAAALMLHLDRPEILAREIIQLLDDAGCVESAAAIARAAGGEDEVVAEVVAATPGDAGSRVAPAERRLSIGFARNRTFEIVLVPKPDIESLATLNAVTLLLERVHDLERARAEREKRLSLWPADEDADETDGAVVQGHMRDLMSYAKRVATTNVSVLITGESGTGKEVLARAIHRFSDRAEKPFIPFNCTAVPRDLLDSQLFGHRRGAFTGADRENPGLIRSANGGTLLLDEIGDLGLDLQPKLLRFLESGEICPLGESTPITVNVRILAATNCNLEDLVKEGRFREDLFYRLNVIRLRIPPLRERREEIPALVNHFVSRSAAEFNKGFIRVAEDTMEHLIVARWPGNVRQVQNEVRRMVALAEPNAVLTPNELSSEVVNARLVVRTPASDCEMMVPLKDKLLPTVSKIEREMIQLALRESRGKVDAAAKALGISRKGLYLKRQRLGL